MSKNTFLDERYRISFGSTFCGRNLNSIQEMRKLWHLFLCKGSNFGYFSFCRILGGFCSCKAINCARNFSQCFSCSRVLLI